MKRVVIVTASTLAGLGILLGLKTQAGTDRTTPLAGGAPSTTADQGPAGDSTGHSTTPAAGDGATSESRPTPTSTSDSDTQKPGQGNAESNAQRKVAGQSVMTEYGPVQVQVTLTGSKITDIATLQLPNDNQRDLDLASYAVPELRSQALAAQSAQIDTVSGATYTSEGYIQSLQSALDRAHA